MNIEQNINYEANSNRFSVGGQLVISKKITVSYGHILNNYKGKCNNLHGHNSNIIAHFISIKDIDENYMIADFSLCKDIMMKVIHDVVDHSFIVYDDSNEKNKDIVNIKGVEISLVDFIKSRNKKYLLLDRQPTAEALSEWAYKQLNDYLITNNLPFRVLFLEWHETENSKAYYGENIHNL